MLKKVEKTQEMVIIKIEHKDRCKDLGIKTKKEINREV